MLFRSHEAIHAAPHLGIVDGVRFEQVEIEAAAGDQFLDWRRRCGQLSQPREYRFVLRAARRRAADGVSADRAERGAACEDRGKEQKGSSRRRCCTEGGLIDEKDRFELHDRTVLAGRKEWFPREPASKAAQQSGKALVLAAAAGALANHFYGHGRRAVLERSSVRRFANTNIATARLGTEATVRKSLM